MGQTKASPTEWVAQPVDWVRAGGWCGLLYVLIFLVAGIFALAPAPAGSEGADAIKEWALDEGSVYLTFMWVAAVINTFLLLPYAAALASIINITDGVLSKLILVGASATAVTATVGTAFSASLTLGSAADLPDASIVAFWRADGFIFLLVLNTFQALLVGAGGYALLRYRLIGRWLGSLGVLVALVLVVDGLWVSAGGFSALFEILWLVGLAGFSVWVVATSLSMIRGNLAFKQKPPNVEHSR
jgi:hypothetical protein